MMVSILAILVVVILALVFLSAAVSKCDPQEGGEAMIKKVYVYVVLFATLMMIIGGSVSAFMAAADLVAPAPYGQTYAEFVQYGGYDKSPNLGGQNLTGDELMTRYQTMVEAEKERQIARARNSLFKSLGWVIIPLPVFIFFQRLRQEDR